VKIIGAFVWTLCLGILQSSFAQTAPWQQRVDTRIAVTLNDEQHQLNGHIEMDYFNNSPDTLPFIYIHLWPNAYKNDRTAFDQQAVEDGLTEHYFSSDADRGYIDSLYFVANEAKCGIVHTTYDDVVKVVLPTPLAPGKSITITSPFRVKIPALFSRLGHDGQSYQISQWYPKPAVYDQYGWHPMPYLNQGEFYSEFGGYDVTITLPQNYVVMATGNLQNESELRWLDGLAAAALPPDTLYKKSTPASATSLKTLRFIEENVHDFAWFADKRWVVRSELFALQNGHSIKSYACFLPENQQYWSDALHTIRTTIAIMSEQVGQYPYKTVKAVDGGLKAGGGMEYPTITVIATHPSSDKISTVLAHEVAHNWFYGILANNERKHAWLDEGINSFYERKITRALKPTLEQPSGKNKMESERLWYSIVAANNDHLPIDTASAIFTNLLYSTEVYTKTGYLLEWLEDYMGAANFQKAMQQYFNTWQFKHPYPQDFERILKQYTDKDISWFFEGLRSSRPIDFKIKSIKQKGNNSSVIVKNKTNFKGPVKIDLNVNQRDSTNQTSIWSEPFTGTTSIDIPTPASAINNACIASVIPDYKTDNNLFKNGSTFHPKIAPFFGYNLDEKSKLWIAPAVGYNAYDGFMAGIILHNLTLPKNKFQYIFAPLYAFGSKQFAGTGTLGYTIFTDKPRIHDITLRLEGKTFSYNKTDINIDKPLYSRFIKIAPEVVINFRKPFPRSSVARSLSLKGYYIKEGLLQYTQGADSLYRPSYAGYSDNYYGRVRYQHQNNRTFNPFSYTFEGQLGKQFAKLSLEAQLKVDYFKKNKALYVRGYVGKFFSFTQNDFESYRYRLATTYTGANDYLYDETYIGRNEQTGWKSQQISMKEGGFKINTLQYTNQIGLSNDWLFALNVKTDLPFGNLPIRIFADLGTFSNAKKLNPSESALLYVAGIEVYLSDYFTINIPLVYSKDYKDYIDGILGKGSFAKTISFSLNLGNIDWLNRLPQL
jgi:hypothetical protein